MHQGQQESLQDLQRPQRLDAIASSAGKPDKETCDSNASSPNSGQNDLCLPRIVPSLNRVGGMQEEMQILSKHFKKMVTRHFVETVAEAFAFQPNLHEPLGFKFAEDLAKSFGSQPSIGSQSSLHVRLSLKSSEDLAKILGFQPNLHEPAEDLAKSIGSQPKLHELLGFESAEDLAKILGSKTSLHEPPDPKSIENLTNIVYAQVTVLESLAPNLPKI